MTRFITQRALLLSVLLTAIVAVPASAQNMLTNGEFTSDVSGWTADSNATIDWNSLDADGIPGSGSALVTNVNPAASTTAAASQCVLIGPGFSYSLAGKIRIPSGQAAGKAALSLAWYSDAGCGTLISSSSTGNVKPTNKWFTKSVTATSPANAQSAKVLLRVVKSQTGTLGALFDRVSLTGTAGALQFSAATASTGESAGSVSLDIIRTQGSSGSVTVAYSTSNGSAVAGSDYSAQSDVVTFPAGVTVQTISIPLLDDAVDELDEAFSVTLSSPTGGATLGNPSATTVTIVDDDVVIPGTLQFSSSNYAVLEDTGFATINVSRLTGVNGTVTVDYQTIDGTATEPGDYTLTSGTLTFGDGVASQSFIIPLVADQAVESDEGIVLVLNNATGGASLGAQSTATLTIVNDDQPNGEIAFTTLAYSLSEAAGTVTYVGAIERTGGSTGDVTVDLSTIDGTANAGSDYEAIALTLTLLSGETTEDVTVTVTEDALAEADETFAVSLSNPTGGATLGASTAILTIQDNDTTNSAPTITAESGISFQRGTILNTNIATVGDAETAAGSLIVTAIPPAGISVTNIVNSGGVVSADIAALCSVEPGTHDIALSVTDGGGATAAATLTVTVTALTAPVISVPIDLAIGSTGVVASVPANAGSVYQWTVVGGTLVSGQGTDTITFNAGPAGTTMTIEVVETPLSSCSTAMGMKKTQVDFNDVPPSHGFRPFVNRLARNGVTGGCGGGNYCPNNSVTRAQMAVFLLVSSHGTGYVPPPATGTVFTDVPQGSFAAAWIEQLAAEGITGGCAPGLFCPTSPVTRAQMAVFLMVAKYGTGFTPDPAVGIFLDVPTTSPYARWIEKLAADGITGGCGGGNYCPNNRATRGQMSVFLSTTFGLQ